MQVKITKRSVDSLAVGEIIADTELKGFVARRLRSGAVTYGLRYRDRATGRQRWLGLGLHGTITADQARVLAKKRAGEVADNRDPAGERAITRVAAKQAEVSTVNAVLDNFLDRYVAKVRLRSAESIARTFDRLVRPRIGTLSIYTLGRRDVVDLLDAIEDGSGPVKADQTLAYVRKAFNWQAVRDERFNSPIVAGMARTKPRERARTRILDDHELRDLWRALDELGTPAPACYPAYIRTLLLTAQRRTDVARMAAAEISETTWTIPATRFKTKVENVVPLSRATLQSIGPGRKKFIFSTDGGRRAFSGFSKSKAELDRKIGELRARDGRKAMPPWVLHDLRRTARSLMSRAGLPSDIAERVLGHAIGGVRAVYDRHDFLVEKADALEKLAALVDRIINSAENLVPSPPRRRSDAAEEACCDGRSVPIADRPTWIMSWCSLPSGSIRIGSKARSPRSTVTRVGPACGCCSPWYNLSDEQIKHQVRDGCHPPDFSGLASRMTFPPARRFDALPVP